ncbi:MAG: hypothetical protein B6D63_01560 [Candidatus Latescibacteria bacterium 4484_7]|nr:MAG: hypothetical protein B6D63_01560 [Candidatus Latescibacteria bacterium 4484_7]
MRLNKKFIVSIIIASIVVVGAILVVAQDEESKRKESTLESLDRFGEVFEKVLDYYVEEKDPSELIDAAINGMLKDLDPHSVYLDSYQYQNLMIDTKGEFGGLGITITVRDDYPTVISPLEGTPAYSLGIQGGDKIVKIEGVPTKGWKIEDAVKKLRGKPGTKVKITIVREGVADSLHYTVTREIIKVASIPYYDDMDGIGYVRISRFSENTAGELEKILNELEAKKIEGLIIDLRSNPGGLLQAAKEVSELFLEKGKLIVYTKGRVEKNNRKYVSQSRKVHNGYPLVVLVNGASASASEIVAGALQDWDKAVIIGQTSFGKGSVQSLFPIGKSAALKLTTAKYFTPSGRCIHREAEDNASAEEIAKSKKNGDKKQVFHTASGRVVYGGGGITPDWKITLPEFTELERKLELKGLFFSFAVHYTAFHKVGENFKVDDMVIKEFRDFAAEKKVESTDADWKNKENVDYIRNGIKREVFRKLYGLKGAYIATLPEDEEVQKAIELFKKAPTLSEMFKYVEEQKKQAPASEKAAE